MSTNFYVAGHRYADDPERHIGKRYAAGLYCWDCKCSIPTTKYPNGSEISAWRCPNCGAVKLPESLTDSAAGRELGFNKSRPAAKAGVASASGFIWAMVPERLEGIDQIEDEYGTIYTRAEFMEMLEECPIREFHSVGKAFS